MIFAYLDLLQGSQTAFFVFFGAVVTALLVGISFHEFSHAFAADSLGDPTPRYRGRLTLNPFAHLDPLGTILLFMAGFGWGKPVPVNPNLMRSSNPKTGMATTAAAGPISNLVIAGVAGVPIKMGVVDWHTPFFAINRSSDYVKQVVATWGVSDYLGLYLGSIIIFGIILALFNLTPLWPLDGYSVAVGILPRDLSLEMERLRAWGPGILLLFIFGIPILTGGALNPFFDLLRPAVNGVASLLTGVGDPNVFGQ
ncbi:MAG: site-2 protease family protein [Dehalococcoidia bacterium]|nr:MAG: site-2 protease family protein [Dehalococcoidia bacterium]